MNKRLNVLLEVAIAISMAEKFEEKRNALAWGTKAKAEAKTSSKVDQLDEPFQEVVA